MLLEAIELGAFPGDAKVKEVVRVWEDDPRMVFLGLVSTERAIGERTEKPPCRVQPSGPLQPSWLSQKSPRYHPDGRVERRGYWYAEAARILADLIVPTATSPKEKSATCRQSKDSTGGRPRKWDDLRRMIRDFPRENNANIAKKYRKKYSSRGAEHLAEVTAEKVKEVRANSGRKPKRELPQAVRARACRPAEQRGGGPRCCYAVVRPASWRPGWPCWSGRFSCAGRFSCRGSTRVAPRGIWPT